MIHNIIIMFSKNFNIIELMYLILILTMMKNMILKMLQHPQKLQSSGRRKRNHENCVNSIMEREPSLTYQSEMIYLSEKMILTSRQHRGMGR